MIKVCHIITRLDRGGAPDIARLLAQRLDPQRFSATLIYGWTREPSERTRRFLEQARDGAVLVPSLRRSINPLRDACAYRSLSDILRRERFDIVHTHTAKAGVLGRIAARRAGVPVVVHSPHGHDFYGYFGALGSSLVVRAERIAARYCDRIVVSTRLEREDMLAYRICPAAKIRVIPGGVAVPVDIPARRPAGDVCVGFLGRLEPVKGPEFFIEAAARIAPAAPRVRFLVAGDGSMRRYLEERSRALGLLDRIEFAGWVEDAQACLQRMDVLVVPSRNEAVGRVILEAAGRGIPAVAARVGGIPEVVREEETGLLVAPGDAAGIAAAVLRLVGDGDLRAQMGARAHDWTKKEFSEEKMLAAFEQLYAESAHEA
ncbi:MAG: glycosyltransferase family 4 protein [Deltaproteobacteria bacterium]